MKTTYLISLCVLLLAGCTVEKEGEKEQNMPIAIGIEGIGQARTRAAVDIWDDTRVSVAYVEGVGVFDRKFDVTVADDNNYLVNTGMEYPVGNTPISFIGYYPAAVPSSLGLVYYDLYKGDTDLMVSNSISGSYSSPIDYTLSSGKLVFEHQLTRITFRMKCEPGTSFPEPVNGIVVRAGSSVALGTVAQLDLNTGDVTFGTPGAVYATDPAGFSVPTVGDPRLVDVMVQPGVPLAFTVLTLSGERSVTITTGNSLWTDLTVNTGGQMGKQYIVDLQFSGSGIIDQGITAVDWKTGKVLGGGTWW